MPVQKLKEYLDQNKVKYVTLTHSPTYTAQEIAASAHVPGKNLAKTVMVKLDGKMAMAVLPASYRIDFEQLKTQTGAKKVELAKEDDFKDIFPSCDVGAMPPFGNLYDVDVIAEQSLAEDKEIVFNAGSHSELIKMLYRDFERLVKPKILKFSQHEKGELPSSAT